MMGLTMYCEIRGMDMFKFIVNDEITLKLLDSSHVEGLFQLSDMNRQHLREWLPWVDGTTSTLQTKEFVQSTRKQYADNKGFTCGIFYKERIVGCIGLHLMDWENKKTSIGYWLGAEYQGLGIMTEACKAIITYAFEDLELNRIEIRAGIHNKKSRAIPERLGFVNEGTARQEEWIYDHYIDHAIYGLLRSEWKSHK